MLTEGWLYRVSPHAGVQSASKQRGGFQDLAKASLAGPAAAAGHPASQTFCCLSPSQNRLQNQALKKLAKVAKWSPNGCPCRHPNLTKCMPDPFQKQIPKQTPHQKGPNPGNVYGCTLWHDFQGSKASQIPPKTRAQSSKHAPDGTKNKMMPPACKRIPKGSPFLSLGIPFSRHLASGCASCHPPGTQIHKRIPKSTQNTPETCNIHKKAYPLPCFCSGSCGLPRTTRNVPDSSCLFLFF